MNQVEFRQGDWCEALNEEKFNAIVSNPPYIAPDDVHLQAAELQFEPQTALVAEQQGLADLEKIIQQAKRHLITGGWLIVEHGYQQSSAVKNLLEKYSYSAIDAQYDLAGIARLAVAQAR
jgi:release factor glutamine methyltransferase